MTKWITTDHGSFVEVHPQLDTKQHLLGDECWCSPVTEATNGVPLVTHNSRVDQEALSKPDPVIKFVCPNGHDVVNRERSTPFFEVTDNPCPECNSPLTYTVNGVMRRPKDSDIGDA